MELLGQAHRGVAVAGLADDVEALFGHRPPEPLAEHAVVVGEHQADRHRRPLARAIVEARRARHWRDAASGALGDHRVGAGAPRSRTRLQRTRVPWPSLLTSSRVAPMLEARSRMPMIP